MRRLVSERRDEGVAKLRCWLLARALLPVG